MILKNLAQIERTYARLIDNTAEMAYDDTMKQLRDSGIEHDVLNYVATVTKEHFKSVSLRNVDSFMKTIQAVFQEYADQVDSQNKPSIKVTQPSPTEQPTKETSSDAKQFIEIVQALTKKIEKLEKATLVKDNVKTASTKKPSAEKQKLAAETLEATEEKPKLATTAKVVLFKDLA